VKANEKANKVDKAKEKKAKSATKRKKNQ